MNSPHWLDRSEYPFSSHYLEVSGGNMHYVDVGQGKPIVMVHGTPAWSFLYRKLIKHLSSTYRCIALDHVGFGLSEKPPHWNYTPQAHASNLEQLIAYLNLKDITLIVHDFGGPIGLSYALNHPDTINKIVILNTWMWSLQEDADIQKKLAIVKSPLLSILYKYFNFSAKVLMPQAAGNQSIFTKKLHQQYTKPFGKPSERMGTLKFAKSLIEADNWFASLWERRNVLVDKPALIVWGMQDKFITSKQLDKWKTVFTQSKVIESTDSGYWLQEEEPLLSFWIEQFINN